MPLRGPRGSYWAVTTTLVIIVGINVLVDCGRPLVPLPDEDVNLASSHARYLQDASRHRVEWLTLKDDFFAEARRLDRPIMVAVGASWSRTARKYDDWHFNNRDMAAKLNREFVCVRVDAMQNPEWAYPLLQLARSTVPNDDGFHLWFLSPDGEFILWDDRLNVSEFRGVLGRVLDAHARSVEGSPELTEDELRELGEEEEQRRQEQQRRQRQIRELAAFDRARGQQTPRYREYAESAMAVDLRFAQAERGSDRDFDLSMIAARHRYEAPPASRLRLYLKLGERSAADRLVQELLRSGQVDWLDGGFFRMRQRRDAGQVDFDKLLAQSTEMSAALAQYALVAQDRIAEQVAIAGVEWALDMLESGPGLPASSVARTLSNGRCLAYSFPVATLRLSFSRSERKSMTEKLFLDSRANPLMMARRPAGADWSLDDVDELLVKLREVRKLEATEPSDRDYADAIGYSVARCIETCRLLGNDELLKRAMVQLTALETFRVGSNTVRHGLSGASRSHSYLGDFTAYADAMLEAFQASGNAAHLAVGSAVLDRAVFLYSDGSGRVLGAQPASGDEPYLRLDVPHLIDGFIPPATVKTMLLMWQYGELLERDDLKTRALSMLSEYGHLVNESSRIEIQSGRLRSQNGQTVVEYSSGFDDFYRTAAEILER